jgi:mannose-6-phosphate isomerase
MGRTNGTGTLGVVEVAVDDPRTRVVADERPWGGFRQYTCNEPTTVKVLSIAAGQRLSLQRHTHRDELWIVMDEGLEIQVGTATWTAIRGEEVFIPRGTVHRVGAPTTAGRIVEVAFGRFDEADIERLEDAYGRA